MVEKAKQKLLFKNCKWFFKKEKKCYKLVFAGGSTPWPGFISANFNNFFDQW